MFTHPPAFFHLVLEASWQTSLIILFVLLLRSFMSPHIPARWLSLLWLLVVIRLLVPVSFFPRNPVSMQNISLVGRPLEQVALVLPASTPAHVPEPASRVRIQGPQASGLPSVLPVSSEVVVSSNPTATNSWWIIASAIWLGGTLVALGVMIGARVRLWRRLEKNHAPVDPAVAAIWDRCCRRLRIKRPPGLRMSPDISSPALVGLFRPSLLLPEADLSAFSEEDWENVFVHELAHYQRADHWSHALHLLALALHWFNPAVWIGFRQLRADRELAADEWALQHLEPERSSAYGKTLLKILAHSSRGDLSLASVGILEDRSQLKQRLQRIVAFAPRKLIGSILGLALVASMAMVVIGRETEKADLAKYELLKPQEIFVLAARGGDIPAMEEVLGKGADVNGSAYIEANDQTALIAAASTGQVEAIKWLLTKGADINLKLDHQTDGIPDVKMGPIDTAFKNGMAEGAKYLLSRDAACDPSLIATSKGDIKALQEALEKEPVDVKQLKLLAKIASSNGQAEALRLILGRIDSQPGESGWRLDDGSVVVAIGTGNRDVVQVILDAGETLNKNGVMRITGPASKTPGMREWLISKGFTVPEYNDGEKLIDAAEREDIPEMARLLKAGADVNYRGDSSWTPITKTAAWDRAHAMKFLLAHGADPNSVHIPGADYTPICLTSKPGMADMLLAAGGNINATLYKEGVHIMDYAVTFDRTDMVKWYLDHGVDPTKVKTGNPTLLFSAGNAGTAELLLQHGVDVNAKSADGETALFQICSYGQKPAETARVLLKHGADANAKTNNGLTPLMVARDGATVDVLVEFGADLKVKMSDGGSLLESRGGRNDSSRLEALLRHGVPFDPKTEGPNMMVHAAFSGETDVMTALLNHGVDPNTQGCWSKEANMYATPLQEAVTNGHYNAAKLLLDHGAKIQEKSLSTATLPHFNEMTSALRNRRVNIVKLFWDHGDRSISELDYAISQSRPVTEIEKILDGKVSTEASKEGIVTPLAQAAGLGQLDVVTMLVKRGAKVNGGVMEGDLSPLTQAATQGQDEIVDFLLKHGAKADFDAIRGVVANSHPFYQNHRSRDHFQKTVRLLIDAGGLKTLSGSQPADLLIGAIFSENMEADQTVVQMLLDGGLSLRAISKSGKTVIDYVRETYTQNNGALPTKEMMSFLEKTDKK